MNRGVFGSSAVQQMTVAGNPNCWAINATQPPSNHHTDHHQYNNINFVQHPHFPNNCTSVTDNQDHQITPESWSQQLFMNGVVREEGPVMKQLVKEEEFKPFALKNHCNREFAKSNKKYNSLWSRYHNPSFTNATTTTSTTSSVTTTSSPQSCATANIFEFSSAAVPKTDHQLNSECNSSAVNNNGVAVKKGKVQNSAPQSSFKVRKFGDRITTLHQLVSPFGKTDTASVLLEAIGYIRFLESQIEALSIPYLRSGSENNRRQPHPPSVQGVRSTFPEDAVQLLKDSCLKRKGGPDQEKENELRSRGLCLVPVSSCTMNVGRDNEADY